MSFGHWGKALRVNLGTGEIKKETLDEGFLRKYVGGWGFIAYYLLKKLAPGIDPLGPDNILVYAAGPVTGQALAGGGRHMIGAKSPLTGGFAASEAGGNFGAELKRAGWDVVVFEGAASSPVYLWINDDQVELRSADHVWGLETYDAEEVIREELGERLARISQCGVAGENLVRVANVMHDHTRAAGRTGLGAVMGSKKLKAVVVRGSQNPPVADDDGVRELARWFRDHYSETGSGVFADAGTMRMFRVNNGAGGLPTRNFQGGVLEGFEKMTYETMADTILVGRDTCFGCPVRCKFIVEIEDERYPVERKYGGPEYETAASFGSVLGVDDLRIAARASQLCNAYGLDSIGTGMTIAFAMECFERGIIGPEDTDGLDLRFGNGDAALAMLEKIVRREGLGDVLAEGSKRAAEKFGGDAPSCTVQIKGQELAMHDPRVKYGHGLGIAISPTGADHMHSLHDSAYQSEAGITDLKPLGVLEPLPFDDLSTNKAHLVYRVIMWRITYNLTGICMFHAWTPQQTSDLIAAITGWNTSVLELWLAGERAFNMARAFNAREGFGREDDRLPDRLFEKLPEGAVAGKVYTRAEFDQAMTKLYELMAWDTESAAPTRAKLESLDVGWVADRLEENV